jgi:hypothetical protein
VCEEEAAWRYSLQFFAAEFSGGIRNPMRFKFDIMLGREKKKYSLKLDIENNFFFFFFLFSFWLGNESRLRIGYLYPVASFGRLFMWSDIQGNCVLHVKYFVVFILPR